MRRRPGFTLIELLMVIGIIAILSSVVIVSVNPLKQIASSRDAMRVSHANQLQKAFMQYLIDPWRSDTLPRPFAAWGAAIVVDVTFRVSN